MKASGPAWLSIGSLLSCAVTSPALAQQSDALLEEIVVTAQKRSESLQDVPIAMTAITSAMKDVLGVITIGALVSVPRDERQAGRVYRPGYFLPRSQPASISYIPCRRLIGSYC
jgi:outer membrane receptor protein involved in Fe transport